MDSAGHSSPLAAPDQCPISLRRGGAAATLAPMNPAIRSVDPAAEYFFAEGCHVLELSNVPDDPECSVARARVAPGTTPRWHRLAGVAERYVLRAGRGRAEIGDLPARAVGPGDVVRIPPGCRQRIANAGAEDLVFLAVCTPRFQPACYADAEG